jgi:hypothetical protein
MYAQRRRSRCMGTHKHGHDRVGGRRAGRAVSAGTGARGGGASRSPCQRSTASGRISSRPRRSTVRGSPCSRAARNARSVASNRTFSVPSCRCSTARRWRSARISTSVSRSLIGSRRRSANAFVTPRYASRNGTTDHHAVAITRCASTVDARRVVDSGHRPYTGPHQGGCGFRQAQRRPTGDRCDQGWRLGTKVWSVMGGRT